MKKTSKLLALTMALLMALSALAGCGNGREESSSSKASSEASSEKNSATESKTDTKEQVMPELPDNTLKLEVRAPNFGTSAEGTLIQQKWQEEMEKYLGIKLDISYNYSPWQDYRDSEKVLIQAGDIPDVATYSQGTYINEFGADGLVLDVWKYKDYMTYYPKYVEATNGGEAYITNEDGTSYYFFDGYYNPDDLTGAQSFTSFAYRFDILKANNLQPATTLDEFTKLCADIKSLIDSGKIDAQYVMHNTDKNYAFYRGFVGIFHTWDTTYWNGEEWSFGPIENNFREMLKYLNTLYQAGYIDPEFGTDTGDMSTQKALNNGYVIAPTLWSGMARSWNNQKTNADMEWGLAYLPENSEYGTPWKWGSKQDGYSLSNSMGIIINSDTEYPEWVVKLIDYQYSDEMVEMMNWGIEGETYTEGADGKKTFVESIITAEDPVQEAANLGIMSSAACRTGIPFTPQEFNAANAMIPTEQWWNAADGYYDGQYWIESGRLGGEDSVSPFDRPPVVRLTDAESTEKAEMTSSCENYAKEQSFKFITGELDINDDAAWQTYIAGVKSQVSDFDGILETLQSKSVLKLM